MLFLTSGYGSFEYDVKEFVHTNPSECRHARGERPSGRRQWRETADNGCSVNHRWFPRALGVGWNLMSTLASPRTTFQSSRLSPASADVFAAAEHPVHVTPRDGESLVLMSESADRRRPGPGITACTCRTACRCLHDCRLNLCRAHERSLSMDARLEPR